MPRPLRIAGPALALVLTQVYACAGTSPPPATPAPQTPHPILPPPPWQLRGSVAEGWEARPPAGPPVVIHGATIMLGTGKTLERGTIILDKGKIAVVAEGELPAPSGAIVIDGTGKFVTPGLIDTHSHMGVYPMIGTTGSEDGNEMSAPATPEVATADAFWPQDPTVERAVAGGVTTVQVLPGSANLIGGRALTIKLRPAQSAREMHVPGAPDGLKMACGENPKRVYGAGRHAAPVTRMGNLAGQRAAFLKAKKLREAWSRWTDDESRRIESDSKKRAAYELKRDDRARRDAHCRENGEPDPCADLRKQWRDQPLEEPPPSQPIAPPDRDPGAETLAAAMDGRVLVHVHCYRADDMMAMLALSDEMGFRVRSFHHALEAYKIRDVLAARQIAVSTWADWWGFKMESFDGIPENAALVAESNGRTIIHSDSEEGVQRLNQEASKAMASGRRSGIAVSDEEALRWVTINPAWALGIDHRVGSLEPGKDGDVVLWSKSPFSAYALAERVWIDGVLAYERGKPRWSDFELGQDPPPPGSRSLFKETRLAEPVGEQTFPGRKPPPRPPPPPPPAKAPTRRAADEAPPFAYANATVHLGTGEVISGATIVIDQGKIVSVGKDPAPKGMTTVDLQGAVVTPGLVDPLTSVGLVEVDLEDATHDDHQAGPDPIRAGFRAADGYNPASVVVGVTRAEGVTSVGVIPHGGLISGQSAWADLEGATAAEALAAPVLALHVHLGARADGGHATAVLRVREAFDDARTFQKNRAAWERNQSRRFAPSRLDLEALAAALDGKLPVVFHVDRAADILSALGIAREYKLRPVIAGGAEAWRVAKELAAAKVPVIVYPLEQVSTFDAIGAREDNAARLFAAGVPVALSTGETHNARKLRQVAANAVRSGLPHDAAIAAITRGPAEALGMGGRYGTIAAGRMANLVVWSGDPLEISSRVTGLWINGRVVSTRNRQTALFEKYRTLSR